MNEGRWQGRRQGWSWHSDVCKIPSQGKIITPGFVDIHRHLWQTAYRTLGSNTSLAEYFNRYGEFAIAKSVYTPEDVYLGQLTGIYESLNAGVTSILDHSHHTWSPETALAGLEASVDSGARIWWSFTFHNLDNATYTSPYTRQAQVKDFLQLSQHGPWRNSSTVSLGAAYDGWTIENTTLVQQIIDLAT
jgi:cytosine/adenosine deaminase-related metal-dependent hydrolase